jgi:ATP-dependent Clp protease ATP-binding subunit ClpC
MGNMVLSLGAQTVFMLGGMEAEVLKSTVIDSEHLWLGTLKSEDVLTFKDGVLPNLNAGELEELQGEIKLLQSKLRKAGLDCKTARRRLRRLLKEAQAETGEFSGHRSPRCREVFAYAVHLGQQAGEDKILAEYLAQAVLLQESPCIDRLLTELTVSKEALLNQLGAQPGDIPMAGEGGPEQPAAAPSLTKGDSKTPFLNRFGRDLVSVARAGMLDPVIGRKAEITKVAQILSQKKKNNPVLVGDAGVGKTCIVEGLAMKCADPRAPDMLKNLKIFEITMGSLLAGTMYRGQFEERLERLVKEASSDPNIVIFIDEIHTMIGAGGGVEGAMNAANILKPALARGSLKCIGATTTGEYRSHIEKDPALERRFQLVWVDEPTRDETVAILQGLRPKLEEHHRVAITDQAIAAAVDLSLRYLIDFRLPDKAVDLIDQACAQSVLRTLSFSGGASVQTEREIGREEVARVVSQRTRIPLDHLTAEESQRFLQMEEALKKRVKGQDQAVREVAEAIRTAKAGLKDPRRPVGVFLFLGSTGTGKTELAKALTEFLFLDQNRMIRIDMSEFQEKHSIARLLGAPPGYVGYEDEGQLAGPVRTNPYSVILFDEIEKAHPDIYDIFLQVFDEGMLTDSRGRRVNFREAVIILTSNLGSSVVSDQSRHFGISLEKVGIDSDATQPFGADFNGEPEARQAMGVPTSDGREEYRRDIMEAVSRSLRPELLNRIQKKVFFYPLSRETVRGIIYKILADINRRLAAKGNRLALTDEAEAFLMHEGFSEKDGARQMERVMEQYLVQPLGKEILEGRLHPEEAVEAWVADGRLTFRKVTSP